MVERDRWLASDTRGGTINDLPGEAPRTPAVSTPTSPYDTTRMPVSRAGDLEGARVLWIAEVLVAGGVLLVVVLLVLNALF